MLPAMAGLSTRHPRVIPSSTGEADENESGRTSCRSNEVDLLSAVVHEMGHLLGLADLDAGTDAGDIMTGVSSKCSARLLSRAVDSLLMEASDLML